MCLGFEGRFEAIWCIKMMTKCVILNMKFMNSVHFGQRTTTGTILDKLAKEKYYLPNRIGRWTMDSQGHVPLHKNVPPPPESGIFTV